MIDADELYRTLRAVIRTTRSVLLSSKTRMSASEYTYAEFASNVADVNSSVEIAQQALDSLNGADGAELAAWLNTRIIGVSKTLVEWQSDFSDLVDALKAFNATIDGSISAIESPSGYIQGEQWVLNADGTGTFTPRTFTSVQTADLQSDIDDITTAVALVIAD